MPNENAMFPGMEPIKKPTKIDVEQFSGKTQGQDANIAGRLCEESIERAFTLRNIAVVEYRHNRGCGDLLEKRLLIRNYPYWSIYGAKSRSEFVYQHGSSLKVRIECRSQQVGGSVDEKFPYLLMNACTAMPESNIWFVIDGTGARKDALDWFNFGASKVQHKLIRVLSVREAQYKIKALIEKGQP